MFGARKISDKLRADTEVVINACELRTGTAFRFGSRESGSWRYGVIEENDVEVATAVAASAAYPALLPAIDRYLSFVDRKGNRDRRRVILTDGGVYENLGVSCMTPDRNESYSTNVFHPSYLICCDAGPGQFDDIVLPYGLTTRMRRAFETTFRQTQHGRQKQLQLWKAHRERRARVALQIGPWRAADVLPLLDAYCRSRAMTTRPSNAQIAIDSAIEELASDDSVDEATESLSSPKWHGRGTVEW